MIFRFFGGKGGVGKTTCAAAAALGAAESGRRVLIVSTDPAHSLGDALGARLGGEPVRVSTRPAPKGELLAAELAAGPAVERFLDENRESLRAIALRGTYLDGEDVDRLLGLSLPGADELMSLLEIGRLTRETSCDEVVVDTAPTAHTLRLLAMPEALRGFAGALDRLQERHRLLAERFGGSLRSDESDALIARLEDEGRGFAERLRDPERSALVWVMLPEALSLAESRDAVAALAEAGIGVREIVVNRVVGGRAGQAETLREIRSAFADLPLRFVPEEEREPRGRPALRRVAKHLADPSRGIHLLESPTSSRKGETKHHMGDLAWLDGLAPPGLRLLFFGGKGGVGKTTCAAAVALELARRRPEARILLLSTDPAHSLADVLNGLDAPLGDDERPVPGTPNLVARELDAAGAFARWRERHGEEVEGALEAEGLLDLAPPGLDELVAVSALLDSLDFDLAVVDTAPTGHALRLLEMPRLALAWDHALLSLLLKYREAVGLGDLAAGLVELSRSLKRLEAWLRDPERARFVVVTRAAELPRRETVRLLSALRRLSIAVPAVVVNAILPGEAKGGFERWDIIEAPATFPPPRGIEELAVWIQGWARRR
jgi:arsenite-transporting ATPase